MRAPAWLIAVDPGKHACGVAVFREGYLYRAALVPSAEAPFCATDDTGDLVCVCEKPQVYYGRGRGNAADLIDISIAAGRMTARYLTRYVKPAEWKGQLPKKIHHGRVWAALEKLGDAGAGRVWIEKVTPSLQHNVLDAVALGLRTLGRI